MYLLDSNILIYSAKPEYRFLQKYITSDAIISAISISTVIEVLGYHRFLDEDKRYLESCIELLHVIEVSQEIGLKAVQLRQRQKMSLGDSIVAATALIHDCELVTRNVSDFRGIRDLRILNPFED
jgi:predicted nucleic acid-binding protein